MTRNSTQALTLLGMLVLASLLMGCGTTLVPFSHELRSQHGLTAEDVKQLQFYVSHEVTLRRDATRTGRQIEGGRLKLLRGKQIEEVVVRDATPGVAVAVRADAVKISFQEGSSLTFALRGDSQRTQPLRQVKERYATAPDPFPGHDEPERPVLANDAFFGNYYLQTDGDNARVSFQGKQWEAVQDSFSAHLMIDAEALEEVIESHEVLEGRKLSSRSKRKGIPLILF